MRGYCKAKRKDNGRWIEGYYIYHLKRIPCVMGDCVKPEDEQHLIACDGFSDWNMPRYIELYEVDPKTLCWYTGMTDLNGVLIWENDIVRYAAIDGQEDEVDVTTVKYNNGFTPWTWEYECDGCDLRYELIKVEKLGNIFDNPELLDN